MERPTPGCARSFLVGRYEESAPERGAWTPIVQGKQTVGAALRTRDRVGSVFVSPGHRMDLPSAMDLALACGGGTRIPESTRRTDGFVNELRNDEASEFVANNLNGT